MTARRKLGYPGRFKGGQSSRPASQPSPDTEAAELRVENRMLRERLDELRDERDRWRDQAERLSESGKPVTGILARIFGRS